MRNLNISHHPTTSWSGIFINIELRIKHNQHSRQNSNIYLLTVVKMLAGGCDPARMLTWPGHDMGWHGYPGPDTMVHWHDWYGHNYWSLSSGSHFWASTSLVFVQNSVISSPWEHWYSVRRRKLDIFVSSSQIYVQYVVPLRGTGGQNCLTPRPN